MDTNVYLYLAEMKSLLACDHSDGHLKKWATARITEIETEAISNAKTENIPLLV